MMAERDPGANEPISTSVPWLQLAKYLIRDLDPQEETDVEGWIGSDVRRATIVAQMRRLWAKPNPAISLNVDRACQEVTERLDLGNAVADAAPSRGQPSVGTKVPRPRFAARTLPVSRPNAEAFAPRIVRRVLWTGGAALALAGIMAIGWQVGISSMRRQVATAMLTYVTGNGQRATITLSDGSTVALGVASRLEVPANYAAGNRTVRLVGEGLFTVLRRGAAPFTVMAGSETVRVLGTSFVVRRYATDSSTTVVVRDGKVAVHSAVVEAARQVVIDQAGRKRFGPADPSRYSFVTGILVLDSVPLRDAIVEFNRWYDVDIRLGDSTLATRRIVGEYTAGSVSNLSDILAGTFDVRVVRTGRVLTLYSR
jgi:ferric-dicitrate binding protein FerR (iron transport regulator)